MAEHEIQDNQPFRAVAHLPKFDGSNHREWNFEIDLVFQHHELKDLVSGTELRPEEVKHFKFFACMLGVFFAWTALPIWLITCITTENKKPDAKNKGEFFWLNIVAWIRLYTALKNIYPS